MKKLIAVLALISSSAVADVCSIEPSKAWITELAAVQQELADATALDYQRLEVCRKIKPADLCLSIAMRLFALHVKDTQSKADLFKNMRDACKPLDQTP